MGNVVILFGPSGSGKTRLQQALELPRLITCTTRPPRENEVDGVSYHFLSLGQFDQWIKEERFAEWATYVRHKYGTLKQDIEDVLSGVASVCMVVEIEGVKAIKSLYPQVKTIYLSVDGHSLKERLIDRGMDSQLMEERLLVAETKESLLHVAPFADEVFENGNDISFELTLERVKEKLSEWGF